MNLLISRCERLDHGVKFPDNVQNVQNWCNFFAHITRNIWRDKISTATNQGKSMSSMILAAR